MAKFDMKLDEKIDLKSLMESYCVYQIRSYEKVLYVGMTRFGDVLTRLRQHSSKENSLIGKVLSEYKFRNIPFDIFPVKLCESKEQAVFEESLMIFSIGLDNLFNETNHKNCLNILKNEDAKRKLWSTYKKSK